MTGPSMIIVVDELVVAASNCDNDNDGQVRQASEVLSSNNFCDGCTRLTLVVGCS